MNFNNFPNIRMRRNRFKSFSRKLIKENDLSINDLIYPIFVTYGTNKKEPIPEMPNLFRYSLDMFEKEISNVQLLGIPAVAIFPKIENSKKDDNGTEALNKDNLVCKAIKIVKSIDPEIGVICDVALDPYTSHGHDGILLNGDVNNDETLKILKNQALVQAEAGCDIIAPSDMMDGRVGVIRKCLEKNGFVNTQIMSYAAKYASSFYGPFRSAVGSSGTLMGQGKNTYQMDFRNSDEALKEVELDISEGADMIIVKPGLPYLDIIYKIKNNLNIPIFAYQVSGEYSMLMSAIKNNWLDKKVIFETLMCFKRAGCNGILTYFAPEIASILHQKQ